MLRTNNSFLAWLPGTSANSNENYRRFNFQAFSNISRKFPEILNISGKFTTLVRASGADREGWGKLRLRDVDVTTTFYYKVTHLGPTLPTPSNSYPKYIRTYSALKLL